ncbi:MAG: DUF1667 domain-containing protein [Fusobacteriaceae bacterium]|jgi:CxxC motif-containing protein|nr:DUF1667 domain-containing protein [Fusobacteriaceae bacterium]
MMDKEIINKKITKKEMICIVCPMGCHLTIDMDNLEVTGNTCERGEKYGKEEITNPMRVITSTVRIESGIHKRLPVKTSIAISKDLNFKCIKLLENIKLNSPVRSGQIIIANVFDTGANIVACRDM